MLLAQAAGGVEDYGNPLPSFPVLVDSPPTTVFFAYFIEAMTTSSNSGASTILGIDGVRVRIPRPPPEPPPTS